MTGPLNDFVNIGDDWIDVGQIGGTGGEGDVEL
jgi:hypothetical protein